MDIKFINDLGFDYEEVKDSYNFEHILLTSNKGETVEHDLIVMLKENKNYFVMDCSSHFEYESKDKLEAVVKVLYEIKSFELFEISEMLKHKGEML